MTKLTTWEAKRAGGRITVYGTDETNKQTKIVGVDTITVEGGKVIAIDQHKGRHELVVD
jgi:ribosome-associated protein YbcJ (S4-like RNA binding protein)